MNFTSPGINRIKVVVTTTNRCTVQKDTIIEVFERPIVNFSDTSACKNVLKEFNNTSTDNYGELEFLWTINQRTYTEKNLSIMFRDTGIYLVTLTGINPKNCQESIQKSIRVYETPHADFSFEYLSNATDDILFENLSEKQAISFFWDFGDGESSDEENPIHRFLSEGTFSVTLTANTLQNCPNSKTRDLIYEYPKYDLAILGIEKEFLSGFLYAKLRLANFGNRVLRDLILNLECDAFRLSENFSFSIRPGEIKIYNMASHPVISQNCRLLCFSVFPEVGNDINPADNTVCEYREDGPFLINFFPNPVMRGTKCQLRYHIPNPSQVEIRVSDVIGNVVFTDISSQNEGNHDFSFDTYSLAAGVYYLRILADNQLVTVKKFIVL